MTLYCNVAIYLIYSSDHVVILSSGYTVMWLYTAVIMVSTYLAMMKFLVLMAPGWGFFQNVSVSTKTKEKKTLNKERKIRKEKKRKE